MLDNFQGAVESIFKSIRRALGSLSEAGISIPSYFASTIASLGQLMPATKFSSSRATEYGPDEVSNSRKFLHRAILLHGTFDIYARDPTNQQFIDHRKASNWVELLKSDHYPRHLLNFGRPVWKSMEKAVSLQSSLSSLASKVSTFSDPSEDGAFALMVIGRTAFLSPLVHSQHYSEALLNNQLAYLQAHNELDGTTLVGFPSEQLLSAAACVALKRFFSLIVHQFCRVCSLTPSISLGEQGELLIRLVFVYAVQKAPPVRSFTELRQQTNASDVLDSFAPRQLSSFADSINPALSSYFDSSFSVDDLVCFSHWMPMAPLDGVGLDVFKSDRNAFELFLRSGLNRNCGFIMPELFPIIDMIIPVALKTPQAATCSGPAQVQPTEPKKDYSKYFADRPYLEINDSTMEVGLRRVDPVSAFECGAILVHVKNDYETDNSNIAEQMNQFWPHSSCIRVCIDVFVSIPKIFTVDGVIFIEGLDSLTGFSPDDREALKGLLSCYDHKNRTKVSFMKYQDVHLFDSVW